jgi:hypothetical protein
MSRTRFSRAEKKQAKSNALWDPELNSWQKWVRCGLCKGKFVVNNYPDHKIRISRHKVGGVIVCAWCNTRYGKGVVQLLKIAQKVADKPCPRMMQNIPYSKSAMDSYFEDFEANCKCEAHVAKRILIANNWLETGRKK